ncbi:MAG: SHOCT domain-containing protein [Chloroflexota bacterium]
MPGLVRGMARTAAVVGTATATRNAVNRRQADKNVAAYSEAMAQQAPPPQEYAPPPAQDTDVITQLERLGALYAQGILTEEEFAAQKAILLGM